MDSEDRSYWSPAGAAALTLTVLALAAAVFLGADFVVVDLLAMVIMDG